MVLPRPELQFVGLAIHGLAVTRAGGFLARVQSDAPAYCGGGLAQPGHLIAVTRLTGSWRF
jgi:hypothetical protein